MVMTRHCHDDDRYYPTYYLDEIKSELGLSPHTRRGHFERTVERLGMDDGSRQISEPEALELLSEFKRTLPAKLRPRYEAKVDEMIRSIFFDWFMDEYDLDFTTRDELKRRLAEFKDRKLPDYLHKIYDEQAEKLFNTLSWGLK